MKITVNINMKVVAIFVTTLIVVSWLSWHFLADSNPSHKPKEQNDAEQVRATVDRSKSIEVPYERTRHERSAGNSKNTAQDDLNDAKDLVRSKGDYGKFKRMMSEMNQGEKYLLMMDIVPLTSKLGSKFDISEKDSMIAQITGPEGRLNYVSDKVVEVEAMERYDSLKNEGILQQLNDRRIGVVYKALASSRPEQAFARVGDLVDIEKQRIAASEVAKRCITSDMLRASQMIGQLPPGIARDEASVELAIWLKLAKSPGESKQWFESIQDPKAKARAEDFLTE